VLLAGCETARFGGGRSTASAGSARAAPARAVPAPEEPIITSVPSGSVTSEPLPVLGGGPGSSGTAIASLGSGPVVSDVPVMPGSPGPIQGLNPSAPSGPIAVPSVPAGSSRSASTGGWTARDANGSCRVQLSSSPALDLYKASASGCANKDLARVTGWDFRDGEVYLYQPGGAVAARMRSTGGSLQGVLAKSGAPLTMTR
jgi:hypothetical protein